MSTIKLGDWVFDSSEYDAEADVLYLSIGEPRSGHGEETPEGDIVRFDEGGGFCGLTLVGVRQRLDDGGVLNITLPRRITPQRRERVPGADIRHLVTC